MNHILLITTSYPFGDKGSEAAGSFVVDMAEELSSRMHVTVVAPGYDEENEQVNLNLTVERFKVKQLPLSLLKTSNPFHWKNIIDTLQSGEKAVYKAVNKNTIDHILAFWVLPSGYWAMNVGRQLKIPYSTWALGSDIWSLGKIPIVRNRLKKVLVNSQCNFADGYQLKNDVELTSGRSCLFLPSTRNVKIAKAKVLSTTPPYRFAFLGRWHHNKGVDLLMEAMLLLNETDWKRIDSVRIFGGGPLQAQVNSYVKQLQDQGRPVSLGGYIEKEKAVELFCWADYVFIPSRIESIPVVFSDAMKCECPVVSMPVGDLPRLLADYQVGILAKSVSADSFAAAINEILYLSPEIFAQGLSEAAEKFRPDRACERIEENIFYKSDKEV
jgi:glycosyltransferase involved in cell wall biosynthesis